MFKKLLRRNEDMEIFYDAKDFETAIEVDNYPWGYTLKTKRRYWVESNKRGDRAVYVTMNPKTGKWCKPKANTYTAVLAVTRDDDTGRVGFQGVSKYAAADEIADALDWMDFEKLNDFQKAEICKLNAMAEVFENVTWNIRNTTEMTEEEKANADTKQAETEALICRAVNVKTANCMTKNGLTQEG
jgi:hypothetical protein